MANLDLFFTAATTTKVIFATPDSTSASPTSATKLARFQTTKPTPNNWFNWLLWKISPRTITSGLEYNNGIFASDRTGLDRLFRLRHRSKFFSHIDIPYYVAKVGY